MENPLARHYRELSAEIDEMEENPDVDYKQILQSIKDFCDDCPLRFKECESCYLNEWREKAHETFCPRSNDNFGYHYHSHRGGHIVGEGKNTL